MNVRETIAYLWELAGEPSDLDPWPSDETEYDSANLVANSFGVRYYLRELNAAQNTLANWKTRRGRPIRFMKFQTRKNVKLGLSSHDASNVTILGDDYTIRVTDPPSMDTEDYIDTKVHLIFTDTGTGNTYTLDRLAVLVESADATNLDFTFQEEIEYPEFTTYTLSVEFYFNAFRLIRTTNGGTGYTINLPTYTRNITAITGMANGSQLKRASAKTRLYDYNLTEGTPVSWYKNGEVIYFDSYLASPTWFIIDYQRLPVDVELDDEEFDIPKQWQDVILMLVEMRTAKRAQENERATVLRSQINSMIEQMRTDQEEEWIMEDTQGFKLQKEAN